MSVETLEVRLSDLDQVQKILADFTSVMIIAASAIEGLTFLDPTSRAHLHHDLGDKLTAIMRRHQP